VKGHTPPVDFCNRYDPRARPRTTEPRMTSPAVARRCSRSRDRDLSIVALSCGWLRFPFETTASRDVMGQGLRRGQLASARHLPSRSLARELRPNPIGSDTSCRRSRRAQAGVAYVAEAAFRSLLARARLASIRPCERDLRLPSNPLPCGRGSVGQGRLTRTPAKGNAIRCTRGAFHRRIAPAGARFALPKLSPACGVAMPAPFSFLTPPGPLTRLRGA
jgi:hypothetical protein